jgi:hypothetical protein
MANFASVAELNAFLATRSYVKGYSFSADDLAAFSKLGGVSMRMNDAFEEMRITL